MIGEGLDSPFLHVRDAFDLSLCVIDHLHKQKCKTGTGELRILGPIEVAVINGLFGGRVAETGGDCVDGGAVVMLVELGAGRWRRCHDCGGSRV
jgi:hypothetical protein